MDAHMSEDTPQNTCKQVVFIGNHEFCHACRVAEPVVREATRRLGLQLIEYDTDTDATKIAHLGIEALPTTIIFHSGFETGRIVGAYPLSKTIELLGGTNG